MAENPNRTTLSLRPGQFIDQWRNEIADRISNHIFPSYFFFITIYASPHSINEERKKKKLRTVTQTFCDFTKLFLATKEKKERKMHSSMEKLPSLFHPSPVQKISLRCTGASPFLSFREGWFQREEKGKKQKEIHVQRGFTRVKRRRKIVPLTLLVEDDKFLKSRLH